MTVGFGRRAAVWLCGLWLVLASQGAAAQPLTEADMLGYLAQSVCLDATGALVAVLPIEPACRRRRLQTEQDDAPYRKHDWPDRSDPRLPVEGYQASDSVVAVRGHRTLVVQTFDFGDTSRAFGRFDAGQGDGGQVVAVVDGWASVAMTEDGGDGVQWFAADACRAGRGDDRDHPGWKLFRNDVAADRWRETVAHLRKARAATECPWFFDAAYTRYRAGRIAFPFRIVDAGDGVTTESHLLDVVVSEHYGGTSIAAADHLERFYFAKGLGMVRWERWAGPTASDRRGAEQAAARLIESGRCPALDVPEGVERGWLRVDCRTWTTLVLQRAPWSVAGFGWAALDAFGPSDR